MADTNTIAKQETTEVTTPEPTWGGVYFTPRVDVYENDNELVFQCDLPGVRSEDIDLKFENRELTLHGRVWPRHGGLWLANEYGVGDFYRAFTINEEVDPARITADYKLGVLTIHLPKKDEVKPRKIAIQT